MSRISNYKGFLGLTEVDKIKSFVNVQVVSEKTDAATKHLSEFSDCVEKLRKIGIVVECKIDAELFLSELAT
jgi:hypothetical protein